MANMYCVAIVDGKKITGSKEFSDAYVAREGQEPFCITPSKSTAKEIAKKYAMDNPGKEVHIFSNINLYIATTPQLNKAIVNEQGEVLPE